MRISRAKQIRKHLRFYRIAYRFVPPYSVLLDGNFIVAALRVRLDIKERMKKLLQGEDVVFFVPSGVLKELESLGDQFKDALYYAKEHCECVETEDETGTGAMKEVIGSSNTGKYMVATQDVALRTEVRALPNVPTMFISRAVLLMEAPSSASRHDSAKAEGLKLKQIREEERSLLADLKAKGKIGPSSLAVSSSDAVQGDKSGSAPVPLFRPKKKAKGPNPLSVKKSKKDKASASSQEHHKRKRKKRKKGAHAGEGTS